MIHFSSSTTNVRAGGQCEDWINIRLLPPPPQTPPIRASSPHPRPLVPPVGTHTSHVHSHRNSMCSGHAARRTLDRPADAAQIRLHSRITNGLTTRGSQGPVAPAALISPSKFFVPCQSAKRKPTMYGDHLRAL